MTYYFLFVMELKMRRVHFAGGTTNPNAAWMKQVARELTAFDDGFLNSKRYVIMDRDTKFCNAFRQLLGGHSVDPLLLPPRSPNLNAHLERFLRNLKAEALGRIIFFGERSLRRAIRHYLEHYHTERNHQGLGNQLIEPGDQGGQIAAKIECRERLGGVLLYYHRSAA